MTERLVLPSADHPEVVIVILATRRSDRLRRCLEAVAAGDAGIAAQTVVCCNAVAPDVRDVVGGATGAIVMESGVNLGTAASWNRAVEAVPAPRIATVHEDARPRPGWLRALSGALDADPDAAIAGSCSLNPAGVVQAQGFVLWRDGNVWPVAADLAPALRLPTEPYLVDVVGSESWLVERSHWEAAGGFHEGGFPAGTVESELCVAAWVAGRRVVAVPGAITVHDTGAMLDEQGGPLASPAFRRFLGEHHLPRFRARWAPFLERQLPYPTRHDDPSRAIERALAHTAAGAREARPLGIVAPRADRSITGAAPPDLRAPRAVEERAGAMLEQRREEFLAWLVAGWGDTVEIATMRNTITWRARGAILRSRVLGPVAAAAARGLRRVYRLWRRARTRR